MTKKLLIVPIVAVVFLSTVWVVCYFGFFKQKAALDDIFNVRFQNYQITANIIKELTDVHGTIYKVLGMIAMKRPKDETDIIVEDQFKKIKAVRAGIEEIMKSPHLTKEEKERFRLAEEVVDYYEKSATTALDQAATEITLGMILMSDTDAYFRGMLDSDNLHKLLDLEKKLAKTRYVTAAKTYTLVLIVSAVVCLFAAVICLVTSMLMKSIILAPITKTVEVIENVAQGDLTKRIDVISSDEIGEMATHFNLLTDKLHNVINQVAGSSNEVSSAAAMLDKATEQMATGIEEAAMQVNSVAAASEEMSKTSTEIAQNCVAAASSSEKANKSASNGEKIIQDTIEVMNRIDSHVQDSSRIIKNLGGRSDQIGEIVELINDVADQTNLLALNAAIEAARAGEHGRGFAVVADEVRKLAERTSSATNEIRETIHAMQSETKNAVVSMEEGVNNVGQGTVEAAKSGEALQDILHQINRVTSEINQIAVASEQETATTNEIASSIQQISQVMQEISKQIQGNAEASAKLAGLSKELQETVGQFKL
jgi:methyl-accepting chemotaxis protein